VHLLTKQHKVDEGIAKDAAAAIWNSSRNIRDCVKIGKLSTSMEDVNFIMDSFLNGGYYISSKSINNIITATY
jgi:hypothetical protein